MDADAHDLRSQESDIGIAVVVATRNRSNELANRCLRSVAEQTRKPNYLVVVDDSTRSFRPDNRRIVSSVDLPGARVIYLTNYRAEGASGAWNVALDFLHREALDPRKLFVAILDDDDEWESDYLRECLECAKESGCDMVGADIHRIEQAHGPSRPSNAPDELRADDFLVGNPGIQGSNLFVRLSVLLEAGLFDERLRSNTDRDLCIRITDLGWVRYRRLPQLLVRHFAEPTRERLSKPGSPLKLQGLNGFWHKYQGRMTQEQRTAFKKRAESLFAWKEEGDTTKEPQSSTPPIISPASYEPVALIVGMIIDGTHPERFMPLVHDLVQLSSVSGVAGLDVVILDNGPHAGGADALYAAAASLRDAGAGAYVVTQERQQEDAAAGLFGKPSARSPGRRSIAFARTMLHKYAYLIAKARTGAVVWVLDGDCRLDNLVWDGAETVEHKASDIVGTLSRLRAMSVDIAIGTFTDAPPVPAAACIRTQLVDAYHNLEWFAAQDPEAMLPARQAGNMEERARCADYYYDLSRRDTDHLETPFWYVPRVASSTVRTAFEEMISRLPRILAGEQVFRPLILDGGQDPVALMKPSIHRGGNTFVFDVDALQDYPNMSPLIDGRKARRSDMIWSLLNSYVARRRVVQLPIAIRHDRRHEEADDLNFDKLAKDMQGYAMYSAIEDLLLDEREHRRQSGGAPSGLEGIEAAALDQRMRKYIEERFAA